MGQRNTATDSEISFAHIVTEARDLFMRDGVNDILAHDTLSVKSHIDILWIKSTRIRELEELNSKSAIGKIRKAYLQLFNASVMALMARSGYCDSASKIESEYSNQVDLIKELRLKKNHDYGEAWRDMRTNSMTDLILMKLLRVKQIIRNNEELLVSEPLEESFKDIANYSLFVVVLIDEMNAAPMN